MSRGAGLNSRATWAAVIAIGVPLLFYAGDAPHPTRIRRASKLLDRSLSKPLRCCRTCSCRKFTGVLLVPILSATSVMPVESSRRRRPRERTELMLTTLRAGRNRSPGLTSRLSSAANPVRMTMRRRGQHPLLATTGASSAWQAAAGSISKRSGVLARRPGYLRLVPRRLTRR